MNDTPQDSRVTVEPTPEMIEAGVQAFNLTETLSVRRLLEVAYPEMRRVELASRPSAADSGDDELVRRLRNELAALLTEEHDALQRTTAHDHSAYHRAATRKMIWLKSNAFNLLEALSRAQPLGGGEVVEANNCLLGDECGNQEKRG